MERMPQLPRSSGWFQALVALLAVIVVAAIYLGLLRYFLSVSRLQPDESTEHRDFVYLCVHTGVLLGAVVVGFLLGKWLNGLGLAYAVLLLAATTVVMVGTQLGSQTLACEGGHNDLIRHWSC